jgi:hypothetical protein
MLQFHVTPQVIVTGVVLATYVARHGDRHMRLLVALQVVFTREGLNARGGLLAFLDLVMNTLGRTRGA